MADFPILKWMQVDGRSVPFTYPQHQKGNGYVVTGEDNPLPTGNHVMTESGIWIPQRGTDEGAAHTQLTGSMVEYKKIKDNTPAQHIEPGQSYIVSEIDWSSVDFTKVRYGFHAIGGELSTRWESSITSDFSYTTPQTQRIDNVSEVNTDPNRRTTVVLEPVGLYSRFIIRNRSLSDVLSIYAIVEIQMR